MFNIISKSRTLNRAVVAFHKNTSIPHDDLYFSFQPLLITIFDNKRGLADADILNKVCEAIRKFPKGLITLEYRPGSLATGVIIVFYH